MEEIPIEWDGNIRMPPCQQGRKCPYRCAGCHGHCKGYKAFRAAKDAEIEKKNAARAGIYSMHDRAVVSEKVKRGLKDSKKTAYNEILRF